MSDISTKALSVINEAEKEINEERALHLKRKYKEKLRELKSAKEIVANVNRELELLKIEIEQKLN